MIHAYVRVSHSESAISGLSVTAQQRAIKDYCEAAGLTDWSPNRYPEIEVPGFFVDIAVSAYKAKIETRPAGYAMSCSLKKGDTVVMYKLDRGFRNTIDFANTTAKWLEMGVDVRIVTQAINFRSANGKFLANILAAYAQWQSDMKSERSKMAAMIRRGEAEPRTSRGPIYNPFAKPIITNLDEIPPGKVYSYARISHESRLDGASEDTQRSQCERKASWLLKRHPGLTRGEHFYDAAVSAYKVPLLKRPEAGRLGKIIKAGDHIVFTRLDRAWRSIHDLCDTWAIWENAGINIHFCDTDIDTTNALGRMMLRIFGVLAQWESEDQSERTKAAFAIARAEGRHVSPVIPKGTRITQISPEKSIITFDYCSLPRFLWCYWGDKKGYKHTHLSDLIEETAAKLDGRKPIRPLGLWKRGKKPTLRAITANQIRSYLKDMHIAIAACRPSQKPVCKLFLAAVEAAEQADFHPSQLFPHPLYVRNEDWARINPHRYIGHMSDLTQINNLGGGAEFGVDGLATQGEGGIGCGADADSHLVAGCEGQDL